MAPGVTALRAGVARRHLVAAVLPHHVVDERLAGVGEEVVDPALRPHREHPQERLGDGVLGHRLRPVAEQQRHAVQTFVVLVVERGELVPAGRRGCLVRISLVGHGPPADSLATRRPRREICPAGSTIAAAWRVTSLPERDLRSGMAGPHEAGGQRQGLEAVGLGTLPPTDAVSVPRHPDHRGNLPTAAR